MKGAGDRTPPDNATPRVGLVLGGGGIAGAVFHSAALTALEIDLGWDARNADVVVGTSAGALIGLLTRLDVSATDLAAMMSEAPQHAHHELIANGTITCPELPRQGWRAFLPPKTLSRLTDRSFIERLRNPLSAVLSLYESGDVDFTSLVGSIVSHTENTWPEGDLRICTVRSDFTRVVFDASSSVDLDLAVSSSCSMPGYARAVEIGGWIYFDGGLWSPTNADVLIDAEVDIAIVLSPMTPEHSPTWGWPRLASRFAERRLADEVSLLRARGMEVVVIRSPSKVARASAGLEASMRLPRSGELAESFFAVGSRLIHLREVLRPISANRTA